MRTIRDTLDFRVETDCVLTLGKFDGLHRGHGLLMQKLAEKGQEGLAKVVFTFDIPPRVMFGKEPAKVLTTNREKEELFARAGADVLIECPFVPELRSMEPEQFIRWIADAASVRCFVAGRDFCFGHNRAGDYRTLEACADRYGYEAVIVDKIQDNGRDISSSYIREELLAGRIRQVTRLLGYPYFVKAPVVSGQQLGRTIGIPTINMIPPGEKLLPPNGVYLTRVEAGGRRLCGVTNVGCKPTVGAEHPIGVETHLLDFSGDLYGQELCVEFVEYLRPEQKFPSIEALREQMDRDIRQVRGMAG